MRPAAKGDDRFPSEVQQCQGPLNYAIIDEVDNILIDEARTPLIISGPADLDLGRYAEADRVARQLKKGTSLHGRRKATQRHFDRRRSSRSGKTCRCRELLHRRQHGVAAPHR